MKIFVKKNKKIIALLILVLGMSISGYLIFSTPTPIESKKITNKTVQFQSLNPSLNYTIKRMPNETPNITKTFLDESLKTLMIENQNLVKQKTKDLSLAKLIPTEADVNKILDKLLKNNPNILPTPLKLSDLNIDNDNSKENQLLYLAILDTMFKLYQEGKYNTADILLGLKSMAVPSTWAEIHLKLTNLIMLADKVSSAFAKSDEDPFNFLITIKLSSDLDIEKLIQEIQEEIKQKIENELLG